MANMKHRTMLLIVTWLGVLHFSLSFKQFQDLIPNGRSVPHPCKQGQVWSGLGHFSAMGGGSRNPFGRDFELHGNTWTRDLCMKDSDGDGMTNGQELGDPSCIWKPGDTPARQTDLSHPGVCDLWSAPTCFKKNISSSRYANQEAWMKDVCKADTFDCPSIKTPDVLKRDLKLKPTPVPERETTYKCQIFEIPEGDYHMVAIEPSIDNSYVLHHMALFGCQDVQEVNDIPFDCDMVPTLQCDTFIIAWSIGLSGMCYNNQTGVSIGNQGFTKVALQLHWFNREKKAGYVDSSGLTIYYTLNKRPYEVAILLTGSVEFSLPPGQERVSVKSTCSEKCTRNNMRNGPINVTAAWNHMHYLGVQMQIEIRRNKSHLLYLTDDKAYSYDSPNIYSYDPPIEIQPGDEIITECWYDTMKRNTTVSFGQSTLEEMCFGFIAFFPRKNFPIDDIGYCLSELDVLRCEPSTYEGCTDFYELGYDDVLTNTSFFKDIKENCVSISACTNECAEAIAKHRKANPCLQGNLFDLLKKNLFPRSTAGLYFMAHLFNCDEEVERILSYEATTRSSSSRNSGPPLLGSSTTCLLALVLSVMKLFA